MPRLNACMDADARKSLEFSVQFALELKGIRGMRRELGEDDRQHIARTSVAHLLLCKYRIEPCPPREPHSAPDNWCPK